MASHRGHFSEKMGGKSTKTPQLPRKYRPPLSICPHHPRGTIGCRVRCQIHNKSAKECGYSTGLMWCCLSLSSSRRCALWRSIPQTFLSKQALRDAEYDAENSSLVTSVILFASPTWRPVVFPGCSAAPSDRKLVFRGTRLKDHCPRGLGCMTDTPLI